MEKDTLQPSAGLKDESQLVTFLLKDEEFGFDIMSVQEIIRLPKMAKVPRTPPYVDGIANLRGVVLPVIDMRTRFGMERAEETDRTRVLVVDIDGVKTGLRVDRVKQVTSVLRSEIEPPPAAIRGTSSDYLEGVVKLDKGQRIVMALNAAHVCEIGATRKTASAGAVASGAQTRSGETQATPTPKSRRWSPFASPKRNSLSKWSMSARSCACRLPTRFPTSPTMCWAC
jgi:purine-binding chemotaxis protein CheW